MTPRRAGEWTRLALGALCILQQLWAVSTGHPGEPLVWGGGVALLGSGLAALADGGPKVPKDPEP